MSYQVLARKWRPRNFAEMAGQQHVLRALINALDQQRLHQAYLFTGTRGVGKTTIARILAKALNCETGVSSEPCGKCSACLEIDEGRFIDLIEVDAASRTKVEDTRELLDNVQYTPTRGRYKVYLIDEVHMLSTHSFNALLKTLEEPPPHVKFLLATTDPQKLPATILSRCLQFNLKRMTVDLIESQLAKVLDEEGITYQPVALKYLAHAADGSMRDALSLLDQAIAYGEGALDADEIAAMLGLVSREPLYQIVEALIEENAEAMLAVVARLDEMAADPMVVLDDLISLFQQLALLQWAADVSEQGVDDKERLLSFTSSLSAEDIQLYYQIALLGKRDLPLSPSYRRGLEMILLRMLAFRPVSGVAPKGELPAQGKKANIAQNKKTEVSSGGQTNAVSHQATAKSAESGEQSWKHIFDQLQLKGMVTELAANCEIKKWQENHLVLTLAKQHAQLYKKEFEKRLADALSKHLGRTIQLSIEVGELVSETPAGEVARLAAEKQQAVVSEIQEDRFVQELKDKFGAEVQMETVRPLDA